MYEELERIKEGFQKGDFTEEQREKLMDSEDVRKHFSDLLNLFPLFENGIQEFKKVLLKAGWSQQRVINIYKQASLNTNWLKNKEIQNKLERKRFQPGGYKITILPMNSGLV